MFKIISHLTLILLVHGGYQINRSSLQFSNDAIMNCILQIRLSERCCKYITLLKSITGAVNSNKIVKGVVNDIECILYNILDLKYDVNFLKIILVAHVTDYTKLKYYSFKSNIAADVIFDLFCIYLNLPAILNSYRNKQVHEIFNIHSYFRDDFFYYKLPLIDQRLITSDNDIYLALVSRIVFYILSYHHKFSETKGKSKENKDFSEEIDRLETNHFKNIYLANINHASKYYLLNSYGFENNRVCGDSSLYLYVNYHQPEEIIVLDKDFIFTNDLSGEIDISFLQNLTFVFSSLLEFEFFMGLLQYFAEILWNHIIVKITTLKTDNHFDYVVKVISTKGINLEEVKNFFKVNFDNSDNLHLKDNILDVIIATDEEVKICKYRVLNNKENNDQLPLEVYQLNCGCFIDINLLGVHIQLHEIYCDNSTKVVCYYKIRKYEILNE